MMVHWKKIMYWILILFAVYLVIELLRKLLGGSLGFEELVVGLLIANLGYSFYINTQLSEHLGWHKGQETPAKKEMNAAIEKQERKLDPEEVKRLLKDLEKIRKSNVFSGRPTGEEIIRKFRDTRR